ncbi:unnamed protein product [Brassica rapa]|uniref:non-specific serine/threonine protein kinase n=1 Tax=Brassica campestris TaxID=3711 RepID=A0A3P5Y6T9_BRACM|nr:unnamed protein product [Brassica rapa]VDC63302.1 unnamed protein product [Brassica rapa]
MASGGGEAARSVEIGSDPKLGGVGSRSAGGGQYFRADTLDFSKWDLHMGHTSSSTTAVKSSTSTKAPMHEWEIDLSKLDMKHVLAHGTYGTVYRGVYAGQQVAVKVLDWGEDGQSTAAETTALRASFEQEVAVWQKLDHPNVTKFIGASMGTSDLKIPPANDSGGRGGSGAHPARACCVVVEYVAGGTLKKFLIKKYRSKLPIKDVIQLALDLARGLSYLHSKAIVHRDVKTENMLLETNKTLKIADFGVARVEAQNPQDMTGETGTLGYMAPEVLEGKPYNRKCDVYSFGVCLWEIYCCDMPYADCSFAEISHAVVHKNLRPEIPKCCPQAVANIMKRCWDPNPDKRPEMEEVVKLLEAVNTSKGGGMIPPDKFQGSKSEGFNSIKEFLKQTGGYAIIDGGLATEFERHGADLNDPLWSSKCLLTSPHIIHTVCLDYLEAGADIIASASYQATIQGFETKGFSIEKSEYLLRKSVEIACEARSTYYDKCKATSSSSDIVDDKILKTRPILVAASVGSYGAYLADGSEYSGIYGDLITLETLKDFHRRKLQVLGESGADIIAFETIPSKLEAQAFAELLDEGDVKISGWFSFNSNDGVNVVSGDSIKECVAIAEACEKVVAVGINCTSPRFIEGLVLEIAKVTSKPILAYPNSGERYDADRKEWVENAGVGDEDFVSYVEKWMDAGVSLLGGCCRTTPATIRAIHKRLVTRRSLFSFS